MKVRELIELLKLLDPELPVRYFYDGDARGSVDHLITAEIENPEFSQETFETVILFDNWERHYVPGYSAQRVKKKKDSTVESREEK